MFGCLLKLFPHFLNLFLVVLCLLELLLDLSGGLLRLVERFNEAVGLENFLARVSKRSENLVKDLALFLRHREGLLGVALSVFFLASQLILTNDLKQLLL